MSNSIPGGKKVVVSVVLAIIGFILVVGFSTAGAIGVALGLAIGAFIGPKLHAFKMAPKPKPKPKKPAHKASPATVENSVGDSEILSVFVGNLAFKVRGRQLAELFEPFGPIESIRIVKDRNTGRGKGFGFVDMKGSAARAAIAELDGSEFFGRVLKVSEANAQKTEE